MGQLDMYDKEFTINLESLKNSIEQIPNIGQFCDPVLNTKK